MNTTQKTPSRADLGRIMYQQNTKGELVPKIGGCESAEEGALFALRKIVKAKEMPPKEGAKFLRMFAISRTQPIFFDSFAKTRALKLGKIVWANLWTSTKYKPFGQSLPNLKSRPRLCS